MTPSTAQRQAEPGDIRVGSYATPAEIAFLGNPDIGCDRPLLAYKVSPSYVWEPFLMRCGVSRASKCVRCSDRYRDRVQTVAQNGLQAEVPGEYFYLLTFTPPGDVEHCKIKHCIGPCITASHPKCRCTPVGGVNLADWNPTCSSKWNDLLKYIERTPGWSRPSYFRAVEVQDGKRLCTDLQCGRGGLHLHVLVRTDYRIAKDPKRPTHLRSLAIRAGFGHSVDVQLIAPGSRAAARYVAKYVTKSADSRDDVPWQTKHLNEVTGETIVRTEPTYRTWSMSRTWSESMKALRRKALEKWRLDHPEEPTTDAPPSQPAPSMGAPPG